MPIESVGAAFYLVDSRQVTRSFPTSMADLPIADGFFGHRPPRNDDNDANRLLCGVVVWAAGSH